MEEIQFFRRKNSYSRGFVNLKLSQSHKTLLKTEEKYSVFLEIKLEDENSKELT